MLESVQKLVQALKASRDEVGDENSLISTYVKLADTEYKHGYLLNPSSNLGTNECTNEDLARDEKLDVLRLRQFLLIFGDIPCPIAVCICAVEDPSALTLKDAIEVEGTGVHFALSALITKLETEESKIHISMYLRIIKFALLYARHPELNIPLALA